MHVEEQIVDKEECIALEETAETPVEIALEDGRGKSVFSVDGSALIWKRKSETLRIELWGQDSFRVRATKAHALADVPGALEEEPLHNSASIDITDTMATLVNGACRAIVHADGHVRFEHAHTGALLCEETADRPFFPHCRAFEKKNGHTFQTTLRIQARKGEKFYGLGQHQHGLLNQKGCTIDIFHHNTEYCIPFMVSNRRYGFLWNHPGTGRVELSNNGTRWCADAARQIDYWISAGDTYADILKNYTDVTGKPSLMPEWVTGFWQSKLRYKSQKEVLDIAREHVRRKIPLDVIVIDYYHWTANGDWQFDP